MTSNNCQRQVKSKKSTWKKGTAQREQSVNSPTAHIQKASAQRPELLHYPTDRSIEGRTGQVPHDSLYKEQASSITLLQSMLCEHDVRAFHLAHLVAAECTGQTVDSREPTDRCHPSLRKMITNVCSTTIPT